MKQQIEWKIKNSNKPSKYDIQKIKELLKENTIQEAYDKSHFVYSKFRKIILHLYDTEPYKLMSIINSSPANSQHYNP